MRRPGLGDATVAVGGAVAGWRVEPSRWGRESENGDWTRWMMNTLTAVTLPEKLSLRLQNGVW